ncbi:MAG TPA: hypothetical protein VHT30_06625 [Acidimicrobiales bacterium]|jgi:hypothetical protein|nr:hypothetical protein [Acidimicrobiales bacterium]
MALTTDRRGGYDTPGAPPSVPPEGTSRRSLLIAVLIAVVLFVAVIGGGLLLINHKNSNRAANTANTTTTGATAAASGSTTPSSGPSGASGASAIPAASATPPSLADAYTPDPVVVMKTLSAYSDWLFAHPNPALVANYMLPSSRTFSGTMSALGTMVKNGWHQRPSVTQLAFVKADAPFKQAPATVNGHQAYLGTVVRVLIEDTPQSSDILNSAGQVVGSLHNPAQAFLAVALAQGSDGQFRISDITELHPPSISAFES